ncbi:MAG: ribose 5-phosphate isomerase B [Candidatus Omnitrophota bacterium]|nr:ribose 5-phosphate isomerase B [Candidatus Omnitrophota bacterium]MDZ4241910.1 ribose 5-phosphate isomerase B [Candidatus Omnitrophota bacterium]
MKVFIGADHRGFHLKAEITGLLKQLKHQVVDVGSYGEEMCDYPEISYKLAREVARSKGSRGILVCMTGIGHSIAANKVRGAYAALCYTEEAAAFSRQHNNSNILVLGARFTPQDRIPGIVTTWLSSEFEGGRHLRRVKQIKEIEKKEFKA